MIVIAIIGILAAIAIPNFISFRDKGFCSGVESDANAILAGLADYFSIPTNVSFADVGATDTITFPGPPDTLFRLSRAGEATANTATLTNVAATAAAAAYFLVAVTDGSGRCPVSYQVSNTVAGTDLEGWSGVLPGVFQKPM